MCRTRKIYWNLVTRQRFRYHRFLGIGSLGLVISYFDPLGVGVGLLDFLSVRFIVVDSHSVVRHFVGGGEFGGYFAVEGGEGALHLFFEYFFVVLEKFFEDIVDEVPDAAGRPVS